MHYKIEDPSSQLCGTPGCQTGSAPRRCCDPGLRTTQLPNSKNLKSPLRCFKYQQHIHIHLGSICTYQDAWLERLHLRNEWPRVPADHVRAHWLTPLWAQTGKRVTKGSQAQEAKTNQWHFPLKNLVPQSRRSKQWVPSTDVTIDVEREPSIHAPPLSHDFVSHQSRVPIVELQNRPTLLGHSRCPAENELRSSPSSNSTCSWL